jgi:hypothetical protein
VVTLLQVGPKVPFWTPSGLLENLFNKWCRRMPGRCHTRALPGMWKSE